jgi:predicted RNA-binding Zn ribbon-like protein
MAFAHDTEVALNAAVALVNTKDVTDPDHEGLPDVAALHRFVLTWGWTGQFTGDQQELEQVRALRPRLREIWLEDRDGVVRIVNGLLREAHALPQLVKHDQWDYHLHATPADAPLASRMAVEAAMAIVDVVRADALSRLRICDSPTCDDVVIDLSKNRSRRFCEGTCGNKAAVAAYRARKAERRPAARTG